VESTEQGAESTSFAYERGSDVVGQETMVRQATWRGLALCVNSRPKPHPDPIVEALAQRWFKLDCLAEGQSAVIRKRVFPELEVHAFLRIHT
jgi:hypothetical protein